MHERPLHTSGIVLIPFLVILFTVGGVSGLGSLLLWAESVTGHDERYPVAIAFAFAMVVTFGAAILSALWGRRTARH